MISIKNQSFLYKASLLALLIFISAFTHAQDKYLTLLPSKDIMVSVQDPDQSFNKNDDVLTIHGETNDGEKQYMEESYLQFDLNAIPKDAKIEGATVRLYLKEPVDNSGRQTVRMYLLPSESAWSEDFNWNTRPGKATPITQRKRIAQARIDPADINKGIGFKIKRLTNIDQEFPKKRLSFLLAASKEEYDYYTSRDAVKEGKYIQQPKLILEYKRENRFTGGEWPQMRFDPQHSGQQTWYRYQGMHNMEFEKIIEESGNYVGDVAPILHNNRLYFSVRASNGYFIRRYLLGDPIVQEASSANLGQLLKFQPVLTLEQNLFCILGRTAKSVVILDIKNQLKELKRFDLEAPVTATPVVGTDGSLYLSTKMGLYAYTPDFRIKWKVKLLGNLDNHHFSSLSLSQDESKAYVVFGDTGELLTLDNTDGSILQRKKALSLYKSSDEVAVPIPIVDKNTGKVVVTDGFRKGKKFCIFDENGQLLKTYDACSTEGECFSQAVVTQQGAYLIHDNALEKYNLENLSVARSSISELNPASSLVADDNGYIFIVDNPENSVSTTLVSPDLKLIKQKTTNIDGNLKGGRLLLAPFGSLIVGNDNFIARIKP